jgi:protein tyrosine phosphatase (PTP) superfamily phosphohydrolase (DUF442 family)
MGDPKSIHNWRRLDDRITTSGQPTEQQLADIHALGIRHIINLGLHSHEKALPDEAASVSRLGMTYIHIPVDFQHPTDGDFAQFCSAMEQLQEVPVHVHCIANYRVQPFFTAIVAKCLARMRHRRVPIWSKFGSPRACGRRLLVARLLYPVSTQPRRLPGRSGRPNSTVAESARAVFLD